MPEDILNKVMSFIGRDGEGDSDKDILLKQLAKEISQNKYAKFYRTRQGEIDGSLGQYFYSLYKAVYPLQTFLRDPARDAKIKQITLESFLDKPTMDVLKRLSPDGIAERKKAVGDDISRLLQEDLRALAAGFDSPRIATADKCYNLIAAIKQFVFFDFTGLLKKFDPEMKEGDFLSQPKFAPVDANILMSDINSFLTVQPPLEEDNNDWKTVFEILKYCKGGTDVIPLAQWMNILMSLKDIKQSKILDLINRLATGNPILEVKAKEIHESLSSLWLEQKNQDVRAVIAGIVGNQRSVQINTLEQAVFGAPASSRLTYYTREKGRALEDKYLETYTYAPALNHLSIFIQDYLGKEVHELCDIILIRGRWTNVTASRQMSEAFHVILELIEEINTLDNTLSDTGSNGPRIRGALLRVDRDPNQGRYVNTIIDEINEEALAIINKAVPSLIVVGKHLKMLMEDIEKKPFELIMNWKELSLASKNPLSQRISGAYKKINYFVQLMILETKPLDE